MVHMSELAASPSLGPTAEHRASAGIRLWLYALAGLVALMVIVGGATRLTDSGLSITEWKPILGVIPPLTEADWQAAFAKYRQIPEYQVINKGMTLDEFKTIYWWEWGHRLLGRLIGFAFLLPFLYFWLRGRLKRPLIPKLVLLFVLGGLQGLLGWYMVMSGLVDRVDVSQYRLAAHLGLAVVIFGAILWVAFDLAPDAKPVTPDGRLLASALGLTGLVFLQIILGAFVAGLDAGQGYNSWPLMDGQIIPDGLGAMSPWYLNLFENALTVQFDHRIAAYLVAIWALVHAAVTLERAGEGPLAVGSAALALVVLGQVALGVWTLLSHVDIGIALLHQGGALLVFAIALYHAHGLVQARRQSQSLASA